MGRLFALLVVAVTFLATIDALSTESASQVESTELAALNAAPWYSPTKRLLRTVDATDAAAEERGIQYSLLSGLSKFTKALGLKKVSNKLKIQAWLKAGMDPTAVYKELKFTGKKLSEVEPQKGYKLWLAFGKAWRKAGGRYMS
ncbi:hypothetical protein PR003_g29292 [Phytophthora rubi]|uniref:RxLR effector protein n=1 Tax=Phytophthora rubi TaxID=129364 RepID=A0A6A3GBS2_9STRA|nr:hypothetical protein PR002_g31580 [Phytophthora rubi]KAE9006308.1 hypothetical protein PR001_g17238 [Phytophthora rubi]KAE9275591.1 hypothetical protein PR003_g29292 [Phytophthora rubi]